MMLLVFDVDGTLTPSRGRIDERFRRWMLDELLIPYVLVTGSDPIKTREQIGDELYDRTIVFNCTGNHVFNRGAEIHRSKWVIPESLESHLNQLLGTSEYPTKTGKHIENRVGLCNFSVVGRNATIEQRKNYFEWDKVSNERQMIAASIRNGWPDIDATIAGETGIDIYAKGAGKAQILLGLLDLSDQIVFFGDRMDQNGNDYELAKAIEDGGHGRSHAVRDWEQTWEILKELNQVQIDHASAP